MPRKNPKQQCIHFCMNGRRNLEKKACGFQWKHWLEKAWGRGAINVMKVRRNRARGSLIFYAKESLKSKQITAPAALMESVGIHLCGTQNLCRSKSRASQGEHRAGSIPLTAPPGQQHWLKCAETHQVKEAAGTGKTTLLDYFNYSHPSWANVTGEHEAELNYLGSLCGCWLSAREEIASLAWCQTISRVMFKNLVLEVLLCNRGHEAHRSLSQWASLQILHSHA